MSSLTSPTFVVPVLVFFLFSGQGIRYGLGIKIYAIMSVILLSLSCYSMLCRDGVETRSALRGLRSNVPYLLGVFVAIASASLLWSQTPAFTLLSVVILLATTFVALLSASSLSAVEMMTSVYRGLAASVFVGLLFEILVSAFSQGPILPFSSDIHDLSHADANAVPIFWSDHNLMSGGPIKGFVGNRNPFAAIALMSGLCAIVLGIKNVINRIGAVAVTIASVLVLALTRSATVSISMLFLLVLAVAAYIMRSTPTTFRPVVSKVVVSGVAILSVLAIKYRDNIFSIFDRSPDFTNRAGIWEKVVHIAWAHPEGLGWVGGVWPVWERPYNDIMSFSGNPVSHAHNAFLDVWLQLGIIGGILFLVMALGLVGSVWRVVEKRQHGDSIIPVLWMLLSATLLLNAMTESRLLIEGHWFLYVVLLTATPSAFKLRRRTRSVMPE